MHNLTEKRIKQISLKHPDFTKKLDQNRYCYLKHTFFLDPNKNNKITKRDLKNCKISQK